MSDDSVIEDERLIVGVSQALAEAAHLEHSRRCEAEGCRWAVHVGSDEAAQAAYDKHRRTDARHTGGVWIDRDGRERRGLEPPTPEES